MKYQYEYPRPILAVDCVIFGFDGTVLNILALKRDAEPFRNSWVLPGGAVRETENANACAERILSEKAGIENMFLEQLYTFSNPNRDPRDRAVSIAHFALIRTSDIELFAGRDTSEVKWFPVNDLPQFGFDHNEIIIQAIKRLRGKVRYEPIGFELLDEKFTLRELQLLYEAILNTQIDKRNFRKKILSSGILEQLTEKEQGVARKAAFYFRFNQQKYKELVLNGYNFEI